MLSLANCKLSPDKLFRAFNGEWKLERIASTGERFQGAARFIQKESNCFRLEEFGKLHLVNGTIVASSRTWYWKMQRSGRMDILFDEIPLRLYHSLALRQEPLGFSAHDTHLCGDDKYDGSYEFGENRIGVLLSVHGPNKDYVLKTVFTR